VFWSAFSPASAGDIRSQRRYNRRLEHEADVNDLGAKAYGLSRVTRHPLHLGTFLFFLSYVLDEDVKFCDLSFYGSQLLVIIFGVLLQDRRLRSDPKGVGIWVFQFS